MSVLVVDDNADYRYLVGRRLGENGLSVREAADGDEALARLDGIEVVLLDYRLPGRDGIDILRAIREKDAPPAVVIVTGMGSEATAVDAMRAGATDYVTKDTNYLTVLPKVVERVMRVRELERREAAQRELERQLVAELEETLDLRRQLVSSVSHELRTPLTAILGFSTTLLHHWDRLGESERRDLLLRIQANGQDLGDLIERLLDFSYIESGRLDPEVARLTLANEVTAAIDGLAPILGDREVVSEVDPRVVVSADATLLRRTLWNLLTNAAKYAAPSGVIAVRALVGEHTTGDEVRVEVSDTGEGMTADEAARVFEPFWRGPGVRTAQRGTGIGLALVRDYVRLMRGEVGVDSQPGRGSTFWFTLPLAMPGT